MKLSNLHDILLTINKFNINSSGTNTQATKNVYLGSNNMFLIKFIRSLGLDTNFETFVKVVVNKSVLLLWCLLLFLRFRGGPAIFIFLSV
jgi:hypothetical protein